MTRRGCGASSTPAAATVLALASVVLISIAMTADAAEFRRRATIKSRTPLPSGAVKVEKIVPVDRAVVEQAIKKLFAAYRPNSHELESMLDDNFRDKSRLLDTITDGDVRRAILAGIDLDSPVSELVGRRSTSPYPAPVTAPADSPPAVMTFPLST